MERMGRWNGAEVALTEVKLVGGCQCCMRNGNSRAQVANLRWPCNGVTEILMLRGLRLSFAALSHPALLMNEGMEGAIMERSGRR